MVGLGGESRSGGRKEIDLWKVAGRLWKLTDLHGIDKSNLEGLDRCVND